MKASTLILLGIMALVAYMVLGKRAAPAGSTSTSNKSGGSTTAGPLDLIAGFTKLAGDVLDRLKPAAQDGPATT